MNMILLAVLLHAADVTGTPFPLLSAVCMVESSGQTDAIHRNDGHGHSYGLCQVKEETARLMGYKGPVAKLWYDPVTNATYAGKYLKYQLDRYKGDRLKAASAYNAGSYVEVNGKPRNAKHVQKVMREYERLTYHRP